MRKSDQGKSDQRPKRAGKASTNGGSPHASDALPADTEDQHAEGQATRPPAGAAAPAGAKLRASRREKTAATRSAILSAALEEFSGRGFAATRLDDVSRRAGVAKGTIYVHFRDKESLFEELVKEELGPMVGMLQSAGMRDVPLRAFASQIVEAFVREVYGTRRRDVLRLIISEGERFPQLSHIYYREVIRPALIGVRAVVKRAIERGEIHSDALLRFPQLLIAPGLMAVLWDARFSRFEPLDVTALMQTHLDLLFAALGGRES
jgi:AcrR family transcriptional regulator